MYVHRAYGTYSILNKIKTMAMDYIRLEDQFIELEGSVSNFTYKHM
jgi:hypothetical protein